MATIVKGTVPPTEFALGDAIEMLPEVRFECEPVVCGGDGTTLPLVWARGVGRGDLVQALHEDRSVRDIVVLLSSDDTHLCRLRWTDSVCRAVDTIVQSGATVMDAVGGTEGWTLRVLFPTRDDLAETVTRCDEQGLPFDVNRIRELDETPSGRYGLTSGQYEALTKAHAHGYFEVPRRTSAREVATELGISQQAFSERLRRGFNCLVADTLTVERDDTLGG